MRVFRALCLFALSGAASVLGQTADSASWDDAVFTTSPDSPNCYQQDSVITVVVKNYLPGTQTLDKSLNGVGYYLRWSDQASAAHGNAYIINADNTTETTLTSEHITTTVVQGVATFHFKVENANPSLTYEVMSSDMANPKLCHEVYSCGFHMCPPSGAFGDPQFSGLQGQQFQVHGRPDTLFNLISYPSHGFAVNSEFVYLADGKCDYDNTPCWSHPGTYFGKMGFLINNSTRVLVNSGSHKQGLQVYINDKRSKASDSAVVIGDSVIHVEDYDRVSIRTKDFSVTLVNSDMFLNMDIALLDKQLLSAGASKQKVHSDLAGLLGQTWQLTEYTSVTGVKRPYKGTTDDYIVETPFEFMH